MASDALLEREESPPYRKKSVVCSWRARPDASRPPVLSMATWVQPASWSQSANANRSAVMVRKVRISLTGSVPAVLVMRHAATVFLWTSRPQQREYITSMRYLQGLGPRTGYPFHA